jgi:hypothetical protein
LRFSRKFNPKLYVAAVSSGDFAFNRFTGGKMGTRWYYRSLADAFQTRTTDRLAEELDRVVCEIERLSSSTS